MNLLKTLHVEIVSCAFSYPKCSNMWQNGINYIWALYMAEETMQRFNHTVGHFCIWNCCFIDVTCLCAISIIICMQAAHAGADLPLS